MTDSTPVERRASTRQAESWRVLYGPSGQFIPGYLADMSPAGVSILTTSPLPVGMEIEVHFGLDESQTSGKLQMRAVVRHCSAGRIGVQFLDVDSAQREHWWQIMRGAR